MQSVRRKVAAPDARDSKLVQEAINQSATQWLFCPYTRCDTKEWTFATGVGLIPLGQLYPVSNADETKDSKGFRYALTIATEIENSFPKRVKRIASLAGIDDKAYVETVQTLLLGETMFCTEIPEDDQLIPDCVQMQNILRGRLQEIGAKVTAGQTEFDLPLNVGKEIDQALSAAIAEAKRIKGEKQRQIQQNETTEFDNLGKRSYLALGEAIPETLQIVADSNLADTLKEFKSVAAEFKTDKKKKKTDKTAILKAALEEEKLEEEARADEEEKIEDIEPKAVKDICDGQDLNGECKMTTGLDADGRCRHHPVSKDK